MDGLTAMAMRVARLDDGPGHSHRSGVALDVEHFIRTMPEPSEPSLASTPVAHAEPVDVIASQCRLLARLRATVPHIVDDPMGSGPQYWVGTGKPRHAKRPSLNLDQREFLDVSSAEMVGISDKPFHVGLFTSSEIADTRGMWRAYLDARQSTLFPKPWRTWSVTPRPHVSVREIRSACDWVQFVSEDPVPREGFLYPNWRGASRRFDAVRLTLSAVLATQGLGFPTADGIVAPTYWDVESTFWLRWCFASVSFVEDTREPSTEAG